MAIAGDKNEGQPNSPPVDNPKPENGFPERYIIFGVGIGIFLVLLGTTILFLGKNPVASSLTICVGFGLVLAAFGARVAGNWAGWSATGAGAMAVLLFIILQEFSPKSDVELLKGEIGGDFSHVAEIRIIDEEPMYIYRDVQVRRIKFIGIGKDELKSKRIRMQVDTTEKEPGKEFFELTGDTGKIKSAFEKSKLVQWKFDYNARRVTDGTEVILAEQDAISPTAFGVRNDATDSWWGLNAFAQEAAKVFDINAVNAAIADLRNDDTFIRRNARDSLASAGADAVPPLLAALHQSEDDYRIRLGVIYALAEMLRADPKQGAAISQKLKDDDFPLLVRAAADQDKTIRYQAAEFLYDLQDIRAVQPSFDAAKEATDEGGASNQILILRQSGADLPPEKKSVIAKELKDPSLSINKGLKYPPLSIDKILKW